MQTIFLRNSSCSASVMPLTFLPFRGQQRIVAPLSPSASSKSSLIRPLVTRAVHFTHGLIPSLCLSERMSRPTTAKDLSRQQLKELREAFRLFDKNNEGKIGVEELGEVMKTMGLDPSKEELQDIIDNADKNGNRKLDFDEFASFMVKKVNAIIIIRNILHVTADVKTD